MTCETLDSIDYCSCREKMREVDLSEDRSGDGGGDERDDVKQEGTDCNGFGKSKDL
jgi:hypothetical protein